MNVLPFVLLLLLLVSFSTTTRLASFLLSATEKKAFATFLEENERKILEEAAYTQYEKQHRTSSISSEERKQDPPVRATRRLNVYPLFAQENYTRQTSEETLFLLKQLVHICFSSSKFYQEAVEKDPFVVEQLLTVVQEKGREFFQKKQRMLKKQELATLNLQEERLQTMWYHCLKESLCGEEGEEKESPYFFDQIELKKENKPIRLFLADRALLLALFQEAQVVSLLEKEREQLYKELKRGTYDKEALSARFEAAFTSSLPSSISKERVNWQVSKTKPPSSKTS